MSEATRAAAAAGPPPNPRRRHRVKLRAIGNSLGVILPKAELDALGLHPGAEFEVEIIADARERRRQAMLALQVDGLRRRATESTVPFDDVLGEMRTRKAEWNEKVEARGDPDTNGGEHS